MLETGNFSQCKSPRSGAVLHVFLVPNLAVGTVRYDLKRSVD